MLAYWPTCANGGVLLNAGQFDLEDTGCIQNRWTTGG